MTDASKTALKRSIVFATDALEPLNELGRLAEEAGFSRVWTTEYVHRDAVARALAVALATTRIGVGTGIAYAFTRVPLAMAALAADVQRLSAGRFALGIGSGTRGVRRWYGAEFDRPALRIPAYAADLRAAWAKNPDLSSPPPILGAALNPVMTKAVARSCDGILLHALALGRTHLHERVLPALREGIRDRETGFEIAAWVITSIDDDEEYARDVARRQLAFYLSTPSYAPVAVGTSWERVADDVRSAFAASDRKATWTELAAVIPDTVLDEFALSGTPAHVMKRASELERELAVVGVTELVFQTSGADVTTSELVSGCRQIASSLGPR
jgi:alkanesulfonate monooxygenase SsuD/methylene tetrahydromethanopterin reductase-like flavin-dependent oxidoreductase (luciferase family)